MVSLQMARERLKKEVFHIRESIAPLVKPFTIAALIFFVSITSYWYWHIPSMGKAIGMLGAVAAVMALRGETHGSEKVIWMLIIFGLLYVEVRAIDNDAKDRQSDRVAANKEFGRIADGLKAVITQNQTAMETNRQQFEKTMNSFGENAKMVTGGNSFCYLDIYPVTPEKNAVNHAAQLGVTRVGKYPLHGITMILNDAVRYSEVSKSALPQGHIPTTDEVMTMWARATEASTIRQPIPDFATPNRSVNGVYHLSGEDHESFSISFSAVNGLWLERLELRRLGPDRWVKAMWVEAPANPYYVRIDIDYPRKANGEPDVPWPRLAKTGAPAWEKPKH